MRFILLSALALLINQLSFAQSCGTVWSEQDQLEHLERLQTMRANPKPKADIDYVVPIFYHIIGDDNGNGYFSQDDLWRLHCELNEDFETLGIQFYVFDTNYTASNNFYYYEQSNAGSTMFNTLNASNVVNVYITEEAKSGGSVVCGYYSGWPNGGGVVVNKSCSGLGSTTLTHEMGHYFGLPHTFVGWEGRDYDTNPISVNNWERVDGSNCSSAADGFCDTPPDYESGRWACSPGPTFADPNGVNFIPDATLFMSYSLDNCQNRFSLEQQAYVSYVLTDFRPYLLNWQIPDTTSFTAQNGIYPINNDNQVNTDVTLVWPKVDGAESYLLQVTTTNFFSPFLEVMVEDTSYALSNLNLLTTYRWRTKPISFGYTCSPYSDGDIFRTAGYEATLDLTSPSCVGSDGEASVTTSGGGSVIFNWSAEDPVIDAQIGGILTNSVNSLPEGAYTVTAIRNLTDTLVVPFYLEAGNDLQITIIPTADSLVATASGGDAPYYFNWNDGLDYGSGTTRLRIGINTISVFDNAGCQYATTFFYYPDSVLTYPSNGSTNTINNFVFNGDLVNTYSLELLESLMTIYPVPAEGNSVALKWSGPTDDASYTIVDALGREVLNGALNRSIEMLNLEGIQPGFYHIVVDLNGQQVSKVFLRQ